jgi:hypothetical protein
MQPVDVAQAISSPSASRTPAEGMAAGVCADIGQDMPKVEAEGPALDAVFLVALGEKASQAVWQSRKVRSSCCAPTPACRCSLVPADAGRLLLI